MDGERFDTLTRAVAGSSNRRRLVKLLGTGALGGAVAKIGFGARAVEAGCDPPPGGTGPAKSVTNKACECVTFSWNPVPGATEYRIEIDGVQRFKGPGKPADGGRLKKKICGLPRKSSGSYTDCFQALNDCGASEPVCGAFNTLACPEP